MTTVESSNGGHGTSNPNLSPATDPGANPVPEAAGTTRGGYPVSEVQPADLAMLSGMYGNMYGGYGGFGGYGGYGGFGGGYGGLGFPAGLGNFNTGMMTGNYITPSASPLQKQAVRATIAEASHHGLKEYRKDWAGIGGVGGGILGGILGLAVFRNAKAGTMLAGIGGTALAGGVAGGAGGFVAGEAYGESRAPKDAVYNDYLNDGTMGTYQGAH